jgi:hypothetical protein
VVPVPEQEIARRPRPVPTAESRPFWDAARRHELRLPWCPACATYLFPPPPRCPRCLGRPLDWTTLSGRGSLQSWTTVRLDVLAGVEAPFVIGEVAPAEQPDLVLVALIVGPAPDRLRSGMAVEASFVDHDATALLQFGAPGAPGGAV